jgi:hypothetical protein
MKLDAEEASQKISRQPYLLEIFHCMIMNMKLAFLIMLLALFFCAGCVDTNNEDNNTLVALGTHIKFTNMGPYIVELNLTGNDEYYISDVITKEGNVKTGPPDYFTNSFYTKYSRDIIEKRNGGKKLSLDIGHYDAIRASDSNLLEHGLSKWPWDGSNPYQTRYMDNYKWLIVNGSEKNEIDAACWINDNTMLSLRMFNLNKSESLAVLGSVTVRSI